MLGSSRILRSVGVCGGFVSFEGSAQTNAPRLPVTAIPRHPCIELVERFLAQRIQALLPVGTHLHDAGLRQDAQVSRNTGLVDVHALDDVADGAFPRPHGLDDAKTGRICEGVKQIYLRTHAYTLSCISYVVKCRSRSLAKGRKGA